jgi:hypothetical protein
MIREREGTSPLLFGVLVAVVSLLGSATTATAASRASYRPTTLGSPLMVGFSTAGVSNPPQNMPANPNYLETCAAEGPQNKTCIAEALTAIKNARIQEGVKRAVMVLPDNYLKLTIAEQTFVVTNLERTARGLAPFRGLTPALNTASQLAARLKVDPTPALSLLRLLGVTQYGSVWAGDFGPLASDYDWMYNDGFSKSGSINIDCLTPKDPACWGHRDIILGGYGHQPSLLAGAGTAKPAGASIAEVLTAGNGSSVKFSYLWDQATDHGARNAFASSGK